jgi:U3 small nucleolar RNA-associated protein 5
MSTKRKAPATLATPVLQQTAKTPIKSRIDESRTAVTKAAPPTQSTPQSEIIEIPSDSSSNYDDLSDSEEEASDEEVAREADGRQQQLTLPETVQASSKTEDGRRPSAAESQDTGPIDDNEEGEPDEPTFGELIGRSDVIDVSSGPITTSLPNGVAASQSLATTSGQITMSLGTALNQALRTDDTSLLDTCINTSDIPTVRATIARLDSTLAGALLQKLAQRLHRRPGRAHSLMSWVQWTLVAHGGALAARPEVTRQLRELSRVLDERARGLNSLLVLKGKLDLLEAQMTMRRENRSRGQGGLFDDRDDGLDEEDEGIVYVEGEEEVEEETAGAKMVNGTSKAKRKATAAADDEDMDGIPLINGTAGDSEDEDDEEDSNDEMDVDRNGLIDDEAEESLDEDEVDFDDEDEEDEDDEEEDDSEVEVAPPPKKAKQASTSKRR